MTKKERWNAKTIIAQFLFANMHSAQKIKVKPLSIKFFTAKIL